MTRATGNPRADLAEWHVDLLRLSVFPAPGATTNPEGWWQQVVGTEPDSVTSKPKTGERSETGSFGGGLLVMQSAPGRIDWIMVEAGEPWQDQAEPNSFPAWLDNFSGAMSRWLLEGCPTPSRFAFGANLGLPVEDRHSGYRRVSDYLNFDLDPETASDLKYQINRFKQSTTVPGLRINRLTTWGVGQLVRQAPSSTDAQGSAARSAVGPICVVRLELDVNTAPEWSESIAIGSLPALWREFMELGRESIREGDIS